MFVLITRSLPQNPEPLYGWCYLPTSRPGL